MAQNRQPSFSLGKLQGFGFPTLLNHLYHFAQFRKAPVVDGIALHQIIPEPLRGPLAELGRLF